MAQFTLTIQEILLNDPKNKDLDLSVMADIQQAAMNTLFNQDMLSGITEDMRNFLVTSFTTHYMMDEIGSKTLQLFKFRLMEKMVVNADYINNIFEMLDNQIFDSYRTHKVKSTTTHDNDIKNKTTNEEENNGTTNSSGKDVTKTTGGDTVTVSDTEQKSGDVSTQNSGQNITEDDKNENTHREGQDKHRGTDVTSKTGQDKESGSENTQNGGKITTTTDELNTVTDGGQEFVYNTNDTQNSGDIINAHTGNDTQSNSGSDTTSSERNNHNYTFGSNNFQKTTYDSENKDEMGATTDQSITNDTGNTKTNRSQAYSDTPQNGLDDVENMQYLTNAQFNSETVTPNTTSKTTNTSNLHIDTHGHTGSDTVETQSDVMDDTNESGRTTFGHVVNDTYNSQQTQTDNTHVHQSSENRTDFGKEVTYKNDGTVTQNNNTSSDSTSSRTTEYDSQDQVEYGSDINKVEDVTVTGGNKQTTTLDTTQTTTDNTKTQRDGETVTQKDETSETDRSNQETRADTRTGSGTSDTSDTGVQETISEDSDINITMEMLMRAEPLMSRLWKLFDPLFMLIKDAWSLSDLQGNDWFWY